jgi:hypothetical protein
MSLANSANWIAGVLEGANAEMHEIDYEPCYRSPAGTGTPSIFGRYRGCCGRVERREARPKTGPRDP